MKRDELRQIAELTDEQIDKIMSINGADVERVKAKLAALEADLKETKEANDRINTEFESLKQNNAGAEEYKSKYEALVAENEAKSRQAEADRVLAEKTERTNNRFSAAVGDRAFAHEAIKEAYLKKFCEAIEDKENEGKADADILHELTKDDAGAFRGVTVVKLAGGTQRPASRYASKQEILNIKDGATRRAEMIAHPQYFPELQKE